MPIWIGNGNLTAQFFYLAVELEKYDWTVESDDDQKVDVYHDFEGTHALFIVWINSLAQEDTEQGKHRVVDHGHNVQGKE